MTTTESYCVSPLGCSMRRVEVDLGHDQYHFYDGRHPGLMDAFSVLPGIELIYNDFSMPVCDCHLEASGNLMEINYCYQGRKECRWPQGDYLYLGKGDLSVTRLTTGAPTLCFPAGSYLGITIILDFDQLLTAPPAMLTSIDIDLASFPDKFCPGQDFFVMRAKPPIEHIFAQLYEIPQALQGPFFKLKVLELLLYMSIIDVQKEREAERMSKSQINIVKAVEQYLSSHLWESLTIEELSHRYCISATSLKTHFKAVYGQSIMSYQKSRRMEQAAALLRQSSDTISQIAAQVGYANQSKFAAAFKAATGLTPMEYRKKCAKEAGGEHHALHPLP